MVSKKVIMENEIIDNTIEWLLEKDNPSVRYFTLLELLQKNPSDVEVIEAKKLINTKGIVPRILSQQTENTYWGDPQRFYNNKYKGTVWQLMILAELGAESANNQIKNACEFILGNSQDPESFAFSYRHTTKEKGGMQNDIIPCLTGNMLWSLIKHGMLEDDRVQKGIDWICKYQRADDGIENSPKGWPYDRYEMCWGKHTCHMGVVKSLKALAAIPVKKRNTTINEKINYLSEYLLKHHIYKKSHDLDKISKPGWLKPGFPLMYQTDILEILEILTDLKYHDPRMKDAIDILKGQQLINGRWKMKNSYNGKMIENIEQKGKESKWITYKSLKILSKY